MKSIKIILIALFSFFVGFVGISSAAPSFQDDFLKGSMDAGDGVKTFNTQELVKGDTLKDNIYGLFRPGGGNPVIINTIRNIGVGILILFFVRGGFLMLFNADNEAERKKSIMNFLYLLYGTFLFFGAGWLVWSALGLGIENSDGGSQQLLNNLQDNIIFQILAFLKAAAFFVAIMMVVYHGFNMVRAYEKEEKITEARKGVINVVLSLVFIKVIDFLFYIAQDNQFVDQAKGLISGFNKILSYLLGGFAILSIIYAGVLLATSAGNEERWTKAKQVMTTVFLVGLVVVLFLLIIQQVLTDVAG